MRSNKPAYQHFLPTTLLRACCGILLVCSFFASYAQQAEPDSLEQEEDLIGLPEDSASFNPDYVPADLIFIPSDVLYNNSWDNANVRVKFQDLTQMEDTIEIVFNHPSESPFIFPKPGKFLSPFGFRGRHFHAGVDIKLNTGDTVVAAFDGKVRLAKRFRGYGLLVVVRHFNGLETVYSHLSKILVAVNQDVRAGDIIGLGGHTGRATTNHLHFETRFLGEPFNPEVFIDMNTFTLKSDTLRITGELFERGRKGKKKPGPSIAAATEGSAGAPDVHIVRKGDTLYAIANRYGTTVKQLCRLNRITAKSKLRIGQRVKLN